MVAMNSAIGGWLTSLRNTNFSVAIPKAVMMAKARMMASHNGAPFSMQPTTDSAAR